MGETFYELAMEKLPVAFAYHKIVLNEEGVPCDYIFLKVNGAFEEMTGLKRDQIIGRKVTEVIPGIKEEKFDFIAAYGAVALGGGTAEYEQYSQALERGYRIQAYSLEKYYFALAFVDISKERQQMQEYEKLLELLKASEEQFRLIFENAGESILIVQDNRIQICNSIAQKMTGYSLEEMIQIPFIDFVHPDDRPQAVKAYYDRLEGRDTIGKQHYRIVRKDGEIVWIEPNGVPIHWNGGVAVQYFIVDITEQKKAEDALKASEEKYRLITEFASDMIWVFNYTQKKYTYVSPAIFPLLGYLPEEALEQDLNKLIPEEFLRETWERSSLHVEEFLKNPGENRTYMEEMQNIHKNGRRVWVESSSRYRYNGKGEVEIVGVSRNIEDRKNSEDKVLYLSYHDQLTGLYNRRFYEEELRRLDTPRNLPITLVLADVNGLKLTNDAFGHLAGDGLLIRISQVLSRECRSDDIIARIGGDEFVLLLPRMGEKEAESLVGRIKKALESERYNNTVLSVSFGFAAKTAPEQDMENIFVEAENAMYRHKLNESSSMRNETIKIITKVFYNKNRMEEAHHKRVGKLCGAIGRAMNMSEEAVNELVTAGSLHDIGKIGMDERLFEQPEDLTDQEREEYKRHPERGYQILKASPEFAQIAQYVLCHHERMDGSGYPRGISGEDIPFPSRILSIADAYDTMTNPRNHKRRMSREAAVKEIRKYAGTQFDETIARIFVEQVLNQSWA